MASQVGFRMVKEVETTPVVQYEEIVDGSRVVVNATGDVQKEYYLGAEILHQASLEQLLVGHSLIQVRAKKTETLHHSSVDYRIYDVVLRRTFVLVPNGSYQAFRELQERLRFRQEAIR